MGYVQNSTLSSQDEREQARPEVNTTNMGGFECYLLPRQCTYVRLCPAHFNQCIACLAPEGFEDFVPDLELKGLDIVLPGNEKKKLENR